MQMKPHDGDRSERDAGRSNDQKTSESMDFGNDETKHDCPRLSR